MTTVFDMTHADSVVRESSVCPSLLSRMGTGGNQVPLVLQEPKIYGLIHGGEVGSESTVAPTLIGQMGTGGNRVQLVLMDQGGGVMNVEYEKVGTLRAQTHGHEPIVLQEAYRISSVESNSMRSANPHSGIRKVDISPTLDTTPPTPAKNQGGLMVVTQPHCFKIRSGCEGGGKGYLGQDERSFTLSTGHDQDVFTAGRVRRLTPVECERLQGFPDNWTRIPYRGKTEDKCPDAPRYKAIGNSWAVPCVRWIGERIQKQLEGENK